MKNSLKLIKYIISFLIDDVECKKIFNDRIMPLDAKMGTKFPFACVLRTGLTPADSKDGRYEDKVFFSVVIVSDVYRQAINGAEAVRNAIDHKMYIDDDIAIRLIALENATETYIDDRYYEELMFYAVIQ